ncbi:MAG: DUF1553 domain-containing protein [Gemmataceae bacterium]|nr:DUF1553 domain-containing protein [Gemmataceae bacterium]
MPVHPHHPCPSSTTARYLTVLVLSLAGPPTSATASADPAALVVHPRAVVLDGPRAVQQVVVTGQYADGSVRDLTAGCDLTSTAPAVAAVAAGGLIRACGNGTTVLVVRAGGQTARIPVTVRAFDGPRPVSFRHEVIAALNVGGCNQGACHGTPVGKNGFKLSLRGYDPAADYLQLTHDLFGRRTGVQAPDDSLILLKALGRIPHEGGRRFSPDSDSARTLRAWLAEGLRDDTPGLPAVKGLAVVPGSRVLQAPARTQQLAVLAHFTDGSTRDVTRLTVFSSRDPAVAEVTPTGLVTFHQAGEVAVLCRYLETLQTVRLGYLEPRPGFVWPGPPEHNYIDRHVFAKLRQMTIAPAQLCTDEEFIRRAHLDLCALPPTPDEVRAFLADRAPDRRARLVDALLTRPAFADFWTMKWMDVLRGSRKTLQLDGVRAYRAWLHGHLTRNTPFDRVVRELLTATGNTYEVGPANYFRVAREPQELAEATAQLFCGVRLQCARCHNHPFEMWSQDDYYSMAAFFGQVQLRTVSGKKANRKRPEAEVVSVAGRGDVRHLATGKVVAPRVLGGQALTLAGDADRRAALAAWLTSADNPFFARSVVNRIWYHLMGRGIVDPVDDFRDSNPAANDELLDALAKDFVARGFDVRHVLRTIMASRTYQLSALTNSSNRDDRRYFSHALPRLLTAEQFLDVICAVTEVSEPFPGVPAGTRAVQLPDGEGGHPFLKTFGQPARDLPCECERSGEPSLGQALQLLNGATVHAKVSAEKNRLGRLLTRKLPDTEMLNELYLAALARLPRQREVRATLEHVRGAEDRRKAWEDVLWALFNTREFMYRH